MPGFDGQAVRVAAEAVESSFKTLVKKMEQHSEFEDTQLFRFFREHLPDIRDDIRYETLCDVHGAGGMLFKVSPSR